MGNTSVSRFCLIDAPTRKTVDKVPKKIEKQNAVKYRNAGSGIGPFPAAAVPADPLSFYPFPPGASRLDRRPVCGV
jgi:hypothetical protein